MPGGLLEQLGSIVDEAVGVINGVHALHPGPKDPPIEACYSAVSIPQECMDVDSGSPFLGGKGLTADDARLGALAEAVERYAAAVAFFRDRGRLRCARAQDLPGSDGVWNGLQYYTPSQRTAFAGRGIRLAGRDTPLHWVEAHSLVDGHPVWVPAQCIYYGHSVAAELDEPAIYQTATTGLAAHASWEGACLAGLYEAIERDAFMIAWKCRLPVARFGWDGASASPLQSCVERSRQRGYELVTVELPTDLPGRVAASVCFSDDPEEPAAAVGVAAHAQSARACESSLLEALFMMTNLRRQFAAGKRLPAEAGFDDVRDMLDHGLLYARHSMRGHLDEFLASETARPAGPAIEGLQPLAAALAAMGYEPFAVDLTTEDLEDTGVRVVRVCVPGLEPLDSSHRYRHLGGARLQSAPRTLGLRECPLREGEFNPIPHPFA